MVVRDGKSSLYNLATDLHEDNDVAAENPKIVARMKNIIRQEHVTSELFKVTLPDEQKRK